ECARAGGGGARATLIRLRQPGQPARVLVVAVHAVRAGGRSEQRRNRREAAHVDRRHMGPRLRYTEVVKLIVAENGAVMTLDAVRLANIELEPALGGRINRLAVPGHIAVKGRIAAHDTAGGGGQDPRAMEQKQY